MGSSSSFSDAAASCSSLCDVVAVAEARECSERLSEQLRRETAHRVLAAKEAQERGVALAAARAEAEGLAEKLAARDALLAAEQERTRQTETKLRDKGTVLASCQRARSKERSLRVRVEGRLERALESLLPLQKENERCAVALSKATEAARLTDERAAAAEKRAAEATAEAASLRRVLSEKHARYSGADERLDEKLRKADKGQEAAEEAQSAAERRNAALSEELDAARESLAAARSDESEARRLAEAAAEARATAEREAAALRVACEVLRNSLDEEAAAVKRAGQQVAACSTRMQTLRDASSATFGVLSELLARVLYLKALPPELLGMGREEMARCEAEAVRHLQAVRDAAARGTHAAAELVTCAPPTVSVGATVLRAAFASSARGDPSTCSAGEPFAVAPPEGSFHIRVRLGDSPRGPRSLPLMPAPPSPSSAAWSRSPRGRGRSLRESPRRRAGGSDGGELLPATSWEKGRLLELMEGLAASNQIDAG